MKRRTFFSALCLGTLLHMRLEAAAKKGEDFVPNDRKPYDLLHEHILTTLQRCEAAVAALPLLASDSLREDLNAHIGELRLADDLFRNQLPTYSDEQRKFFTELATDAIEDARTTLRSDYGNS